MGGRGLDIQYGREGAKYFSKGRRGLNIPVWEGGGLIFQYRREGA